MIWVNITLEIVLYLIGIICLIIACLIVHFHALYSYFMHFIAPYSVMLSSFELLVAHTKCLYYFVLCNDVVLCVRMQS